MSKRIIAFIYIYTSLIHSLYVYILYIPSSLIIIISFLCFGQQCSLYFVYLGLAFMVVAFMVINSKPYLKLFICCIYFMGKFFWVEKLRLIFYLHIYDLHIYDLTKNTLHIWFIYIYKVLFLLYHEDA